MARTGPTWRMPQLGESLGDYVRAAREAQGLSRDDLVRSTALSQSAIRKIEDGRTENPGFFTILAVWHELELPIEGLTKLATPPKSEAGSMMS